MGPFDIGVRRAKMLFSWIALFVFGEVVCQPHGHETNLVPGVVCYHCGGRHDHFPACLFEQHVCSHDDLCYMSNKHGEMKTECWTKNDCHHIIGHQCSLAIHSDCEICCSNDTCVSQHLAAVDPRTPVVTTHAVTTRLPTTHPTTQPTTTKLPVNLWNRLIAGPCDDTLAGGGCQSGISKICQDAAGVAMCPQTCGLCSHLHDIFNGVTTCQDQLLHDECQLVASPIFCHGSLAGVSCPRTCDLCEAIILKLIENIVESSGTTAATVTQKEAMAPVLG